jgi:hypothetical protein
MRPSFGLGCVFITFGVPRLVVLKSIDAARFITFGVPRLVVS